MRIFKALFCFAFFVLGFSLCEGQSWMWVKQGINNSSGAACDPLSMAIDKLGNAYETGAFYSPVTFGSFKLNGFTSTYDVFLVKYDSGGNAIWANAANMLGNGAWGSQGNSVTTDMDGNIYTTGYFGDKIVFGADTLNSISWLYNVFLTKYDNNGNVIWAKSGNLASRYCYVIGNSLKADNENNIYVAGYFHDTVTFGSFMLTSIVSSADNFLVKYDSSGNVLWAKSGVVSDTYGCDGFTVTTDNNNNIYITGDFTDSVTFGSYKLKSTAVDNGFIVKYDSNGNVLWADKAIGSYNKSNGVWSTIIADNYGNIYLTGTFYDTMTFGPYLLTTVSTHGDVFLVKYNKSGNVVWAKSAISPSAYTGYYVEGYSLTLDKWNHLFVCGTFNDTISFGGIRLISDSVAPSFLIEFDTSGNALCGAVINNVNDDANSIVADPLSHDIYFGGDAEGYDTCIFGKDTIGEPKGWGEYAFFAKWQPCGVSSSLNISGSSDSICQNSCKGTVKVNPNGGNPPYTYSWSNGETTQIDTGLCVGTYTVMVTDSAGNKASITDTVFAKPVPVVTLSYQSADTINGNAGAIKLFGTPSGGTYSGFAVHGNYFYPDSLPCWSTSRFTYSYTGSNGCTATAKDSIFIVCEGIEQLTMDNGQWIIEPNPGNGKFTIQSSVVSGQWSVIVYNVLGQKVYSHYQITNPPGRTNYQIDLSSNPNGVYFYRVLKGDGSMEGEGKVVIEK